MSWFAGDDRFPEHPKVLRLRRSEHFEASIALWMLCGMWAAGDQQARDTGRVPIDVVATRGVTDWRSAMDALVLANLWELDPLDAEVIVIHDWADWNGPDAKTKRIERRLESDRLRQAARRERVSQSKSRDASRDDSRDSPGRSRDGHVHTGNGNGNGSSSAASTSVETRAANESRHTPAEKPVREDVERLCKHLADRIQANGSPRPSITQEWRDECRRLLDRDKRTEEQVHRAIDWSQDSDFWRPNVQSMPKLRKQYDQMRLQAARGRAIAAADHFAEPTQAPARGWEFMDAAVRGGAQ